MKKLKEIFWQEDKKKHANRGIGIWVICLVGILIVNLFDISDYWLISEYQSALPPVYIAGIYKETKDGISGKGNADVADFLATIAIPTILTLLGVFIF